MEIRVTIDRFDPEGRGSYSQDYRVPAQSPLSLLELLHIIRNEFSPDLAFRDYCCFQGRCASCVVLLNQKPVKACTALIQPGEEIRVGPVSGKTSYKDLVT